MVLNRFLLGRDVKDTSIDTQIAWSVLLVADGLQDQSPYRTKVSAPKEFTTLKEAFNAPIQHLYLSGLRTPSPSAESKQSDHNSNNG
jgi:hypothetical protein